MSPATRLLRKVAVACLWPTATTLSVGVSLLSGAVAQTTTTYTITGNAMPWQWASGGLNSSYSYGMNDGAGPVIIDVSGAQGQSVTIQYVSGTVSAGSSFPNVDGNGDQAGGPANNNNGASGKPFPSLYMSPYPIYLTELVGTFADSTGMIVGTPFAVGDGPTSETVPPGATQLQLGTNDDIFSDNTGSWTVSVTIPPSDEECSDGGRRIVICRDGKPISESYAPTYVDVGQPVALQGYPSATDGQSSPWSVPGPIVGGYSVVPEQSSTVLPTDLTQGSTTFYWTRTGTYLVTYSPVNGGGTASATFVVKGPNSPVVDTTAGFVEIVRTAGGKTFQNPPYLSCGDPDLPCVEFQERGEPDYDGKYEWIQLLNYDTIRTVFRTGRVEICTNIPGLDTNYPYNDKAGDETNDSPHKRLGRNEVVQSRRFSARMYLMWLAPFENSIPVPFGYVDWSWSGRTEFDFFTQMWTEPRGRPTIKPFVPMDLFPVWNAVINGQTGQNVDCSQGNGPQ